MSRGTPLAPVTEIPENALRAFEADSNRIAVANVSGTFYAFSDVCTHKRCPLSKGALDGTTVTCPCHGSQFDVTTGAVLRGPAEEPVPSYPIRVEGNALVVEI